LYTSTTNSVQVGPILVTVQTIPASPMFHGQLHVQFNVSMKNTSGAPVSITSDCLNNAKVTADFASPPALPLVDPTCVWIKYPTPPNPGGLTTTWAVGQTKTFTCMWYLMTNAGGGVPNGQYQLHSYFNNVEIVVTPMLIKPGYR
jgi:hypothetical protein